MFPIKSTVLVDFNVFEDFFIFSLFRSKQYKTAKRGFFLPYFLMIPLGIITILLELHVMFPIMLFSLSSIMFLAFGYLFFIAPKSNYKKAKEIFLSPQYFEIFEDYFIVSQEGKGTKGYSEISYSHVHKVYETHNAFYIELPLRVAYALPKKYLNNDQVTMISDLFTKKFNKKTFKICYKK
jgi:hypothetical protein